MKRLLVICILFGAWAVNAQPNINKLEYFVDTDPGYGAGINVPITPATSLTDFTFNVLLSSYSDGFHTLFVRTRDANNNWSMAYSKPFYKLSSSAVPSAPNINKLEYFVDADPGYGAGTNVTIAPATSLTDFVFNVPLSSLADGFHTLFVRTRDANNNWSMAYSRPFYKLSTSAVPPLPNINKLEYFVGADPGYGSGTDVPITPGTSIIDKSFVVPVGSLPEGSYKITFRARDANNQWSIVLVKDINVCNHPSTTANVATNITSSGFTASWPSVDLSTNYQLDVSTDNFLTFVSGYNAKSIPAVDGTVSTFVTGLSQATTYQYRVQAVFGCASVNSNAVSVTTLATPPANQPTNLVFSAPGSTSLSATFTAPGIAPTGYLVVRKVGSYTTFVPANNTTYAKGSIVDGTAVIADNDANTVFGETGLTPNTQYYYTVFAFNQVGALTSYLTSSPLQNNTRTKALEPTAQPTAMQFSAVTDVSLTVGYTASVGGADGYIVLRKAGSAPTSVPTDGTVYTTTVGADAVAYVGPATTFDQTGLTQNTNYYYAAYAYNGTGSAINYLTTAPLQNNQLTPITPPTSQPGNLNLTSTPTSITGTYTAATGSVAGYLVIRRAGSSPTFVPQTNVLYNVGADLGSGMTVAYVGSALNFTDTPLASSTEYFYDVFAYSQSGGLVGYRTASPLEGSKTTFTAEPTGQASNVVFSGVTTSSITVSFTAASPVPGGYLVLRKAGSVPTSVPTDGVAYAATNPIGDGVVTHVGALTSFTDSGLLPGTTYYYQIFSYNGSGAATNYVTSVTSANSGSKITVPDKPVVGTTTAVNQTGFTITWAAVTGAAEYRVDVSKDNFVSLITGFNDLAVSGTLKLVNNLESGIQYKFRVRAVNASGTSANSEEGIQFTIPATPTLAAATSVGQTEFTANWNAVTGANTYYLDVSIQEAFTTFVTLYQNKNVGNVTATLISGLNPGIRYYYRLRSENEGGTSPSSSTQNQLLIPATPTGLEAKAINTSTTYFRAEWSDVTGATGYRIDVSSTSDFTSLLTGYSNRLSDESLSEQLVTGLASGTDYWFRVRAENASGTSPSSPSLNVQTQLPGTGLPLQLSVPTYPASHSGQSVNASVIVTGGTPPYVLTFYHRGITGTNYTPDLITSTTSTYQASVITSMMDELGVEFFFKVVDGAGIPVESGKHFIYRATGTTATQIPFTRFGGTGESYELFSIPYQLTDNLIASIFEELGEYEKSKWRLVRYQGGRNVDFGAGINRIELGNGYWFNRKEDIAISFTQGVVSQANQTTDAVLRLEPGWNQIGNPFPFDVDWNDVLASNGSINLIGNLKVFNPTGLHLNDESNNLKAWSGGFVHNGNSSVVELKLPVLLKNSAGGRKKENDLPTEVGGNEWLLPIALKQGKVENQLTGIGMHPDASFLQDEFDDFTAPRFLNHLELYAFHDEAITPKFSRDVVPSTTTHTWSLQLEGNGNDPISLTWPQQPDRSEAQLFLHDVSTNSIIDMKQQSSYVLPAGEKHLINVYYGQTLADVKPDLMMLGQGYPNPFSNEVRIPFASNNEKITVSIEMYDLLGRQVVVVAQGKFATGFHQVAWNGLDFSGNPISPGIYICQMKVNGRIISNRIMKQ